MLRELPPDDGAEMRILTKVMPPDEEDGYYEFRFGSMVCGCPATDTDGNAIPVPEAGDTVATYGSFGHPIRGIFLKKSDGWHCVYYRTQQEQAAHQTKQVEEMNRKEREDYERKKPDIEARIAALPPEFRARFDRFNAGSPDFCWRFSEYELFCCEQAVAFVGICPTIVELEVYRKLTPAEQKAQLPEGPTRDAFEGHSGNTFGCAIAMAAVYVGAPQNLVKMHGALVPLVGCVAYGCTHPDQK